MSEMRTDHCTCGAENQTCTVHVNDRVDEFRESTRKDLLKNHVISQGFKEDVALAFKTCNEQRERITALEAQLATAQRERDDLHTQLIEVTDHRCTLVKQLAEARRLAEWTPITPETMPKKSGDDFYVAILTDSHMSMTNRLSPYDVVSGWYLNTMPQLYTHFRPINAPTKEG